MHDWLEGTKGYNECVVQVRLDAPQDSRTGYMLNNMLYSNTDLTELAPDFRGCPHNGGEHTCTVTGTRQEVITWLDLVVEEYPDWEYAATKIKGHIRKEFLGAEWRKYGRINIHLKKMECLKLERGQDRPDVKPWFKGEWENEERKNFKPTRRQQLINEKNRTGRH
ncbi:hypothetical protein PQC06_gp093 [Aeromonas phage LAh10]|uniref:Uncharacterized protein n=1 Tax=Aeromonas phage LAh10 TaxID=2591025 RepID=A0A514A1K5_9CAUD|nr:hypothetical protein PQC06_gp093 [Aeromonas phage LAh10]QDH47168.1 hypothetical protein LAh10_93 [Aeromonas phage LAh10]